MDSPVERYLAELRKAMRGNPFLARRVLEEVTDHLAEAVAAERRAGMEPREAEEAAVRRMGAPDHLAHGFDPFDFPMKMLLFAAASSTVLMAMWLSWVVLYVLRARDPAHLPQWRIVAAAFLAYGALTFAFLIRGRRPAWLRVTMLALSVVAIALGVWGVTTMIQVGQRGGHFEGYIVLMGVLLAGHGLAALGYERLTTRIARKVHG